ncbi:endoglucanase D precursor [Ilyonectria robusta]|uniref:endoglucanase D precursor n=1 Tax=Ilyonectria robusta TaxID=1079257 RepID=UPI001E8E1F7F|nr:endoglucanase D precursor [Ilyonectria robusta]KAH8734154.1 endoglucanase D precursor [Ilyonectria robusta]
MHRVSLFLNIALASLCQNVLVHCQVTCSGEFDAISASEFVNRLSPGWNLGNSLDAFPNEDSWNNPKVVESTFDDVKDAGFKSIRLPVTWAYHFTGTSNQGDSPDWTVDPAWLERVSNVVRMVTSRGLYAIVNVHHDSALWADYSLSDANYTMIEEKFYRLWYQIGEKLACTSSLVAFEAINEPRGETEEHFARLLNLNNLFLQAINDAGGFNAQRVATLGGPGQDMTATSQWFERPDAKFTNPYALQVHYYAPYDFTSAAWGKTIWGSESDMAQLENGFELFRNNFTDIPVLFRNNFTDIPVVVGEWLVSPVHSEPAARWKYHDFLARMCVKYNFSPIIWDTGNDHLDRQSHTWHDPTGIQILTNALEGIDNSLPDSTTDAYATSQYSSAFAFLRIHDSVQDQSLPFLFNGNSVKAIKDGDISLSEGTDYSITDENIVLHASFLSEYFDPASSPGVKTTLSVSFSAGASIPIQLVLWDPPAVPKSKSAAVVGSELSISVNWNGVSKPAAVAAFKSDGTPLVDDWTIYLPPLGQGRTTYGAQWTWNWNQDGVTITAGAVEATVKSGQSATFVIESYPRVEGNQVNYTLVV